MRPDFWNKKQPGKQQSTITKKNRDSGTASRMFTSRRHDETAIKMTRNAILGGIIATIAAFAFLFLAGQFASQDFMPVLIGIIVLCGIMAFDIISRRIWENRLSATVEKLSTNHDRLVREVARNRNDLGLLKEGLGGLTHSVDNKSYETTHPANSNSVEANMIKAIVNRLSALGERPRPKIGTRHDHMVLELEVAPPPARHSPANDSSAGYASHEKYSDTVIEELVQHAIREDKINIFMQPIVSLPQRKTRMYEIFGRVRANAGIYLPAARYMDFARREELVAAIDNLMLLRCLQMLRNRRMEDDTAPYFINISAMTLRDKSFMNDLIAFLGQNAKMAKRIVFEIPQDELFNTDSKTRILLASLSKIGCRFSMDCVRLRHFDMEFLKSLQIRFIKLDAAWIINEASTSAGHNRIARLKKHFDAYGIDMIIEKIESEDMLRELLDFNIDYGQGYLFGKPDHSAAFYKKAA